MNEQADQGRKSMLIRNENTLPRQLAQTDGYGVIPYSSSEFAIVSVEDISEASSSSHRAGNTPNQQRRAAGRKRGFIIEIIVKAFRRQAD
jgi:hypothetical protein